MCDNDRSYSVTVGLERSAESCSFSSPCHSSSLRQSPAGRCRDSELGRGSEGRSAASGSFAMPLATAERIYRCLGAGRSARAGDVLLRPEGVSRSTLRRWLRSGWIVHPRASRSHRQGLCCAPGSPGGRGVRSTVWSKHPVPVGPLGDTHLDPEPIRPPRPHVFEGPAKAVGSRAVDRPAPANP